jgi:hypothetical protein
MMTASCCSPLHRTADDLGNHARLDDVASNIWQALCTGDREAQRSLGYRLVLETNGTAETPLGAAGRSPLADVGLEFYTTSQNCGRICSAWLAV